MAIFAVIYSVLDHSGTVLLCDAPLLFENKNLIFHTKTMNRGGSQPIFPGQFRYEWLQPRVPRATFCERAFEILSAGLLKSFSVFQHSDEPEYGCEPGFARFCHRWSILCGFLSHFFFFFANRHRWRRSIPLLSYVKRSTEKIRIQSFFFLFRWTTTIHDYFWNISDKDSDDSNGGGPTISNLNVTCQG